MYPEYCTRALLNLSLPVVLVTFATTTPVYPDTEVRPPTTCFLRAPRVRVCVCQTEQIHVIEVSDLKGKDASGTSDPTVYASCLGTTKHSRVRKGVNSAVFDEVLYFNLLALTRCEYKCCAGCSKPVNLLQPDLRYHAGG